MSKPTEAQLDIVRRAGLAMHLDPEGALVSMAERMLAERNSGRARAYAGMAVAGAVVMIWEGEIHLDWTLVLLLTIFAALELLFGAWHRKRSRG